ncbi:CheR family methyltransferase [Methylobacterium pseudosasicola]|uniref:Chemotaxis protein methyltransferase n=1 Tax=Methylobacterium pseudosasicola TaxID=582667 RepID=A0A1I4GPW5_9HYPH|nr:CheR family methyltransferase [Methylobacterium pseudosasicola]SFL31530.1 chemotaxis protein methyltransferase CheR/two-component system, chemotaxis family, response regulator CheB [Methylobacterium pseudosasicola]
MPRLKDRHFDTVAEMIQDRVGIQIPPAKRTMVEGRLRKRMRALEIESLSDYGRHVFEEGHLSEEFVHIIDCVTTNKTDFFREPAHFDQLRDELVPMLLRGAAAQGRLKLWSAAASTGAEAYTLAMVLHEMAMAGHALDYAILGTDVSTEVLRVAADGIYPEDVLQAVPPHFRRRYVMNARDPSWKVGRIVPELRSRVRFKHLNLMNAQYAVDRDIDIIFCRNVLIYFDKDTQRAVLSRLATHLQPGGFLVVGHSESMAGAGVPGLVQVSSTIFARSKGAIG